MILLCKTLINFGLLMIDINPSGSQIWIYNKTNYKHLIKCDVGEILG